MSAKVWDRFRFVGILGWLFFTVSFAIWWFWLSNQHIRLLRELQPTQTEHWERQERMLIWEGTSWIVLLLLGGIALIYLVFREQRRIKVIQEFFASFTHEIKTSLASLRLQAEALQDEIPHKSAILDRLIGDTVRLQLQLENSLFLASQNDLRLLIQPIRMQMLIDRLREQWPQLQIALKQDVTIAGDDRAVRTILSNLVQNAIVHGQASQLEIEVELLSDQKCVLVVKDNGKGFTGDVQGLGSLFNRPTSTSGSGMGIYISRVLTEKMQGQLDISPSSGSGFEIRLTLPRMIK